MAFPYLAAGKQQQRRVLAAHHELLPGIEGLARHPLGPGDRMRQFAGAPSQHRHLAQPQLNLGEAGSHDTLSGVMSIIGGTCTPRASKSLRASSICRRSPCACISASVSAM